MPLEHHLNQNFCEISSDKRERQLASQKATAKMLICRHVQSKASWNPSVNTLWFAQKRKINGMSGPNLQTQWTGALPLRAHVLKLQRNSWIWSNGYSAPAEQHGMCVG